MNPGNDSLEVTEPAGCDLLPETDPHGDGIPETGQLEQRYGQAAKEGNPSWRGPAPVGGDGQAVQRLRPSRNEQNDGNVVPGRDTDDCRDYRTHARGHVQKHGGSVEPEYDEPQPLHAGVRAQQSAHHEEQAQGQAGQAGGARPDRDEGKQCPHEEEQRGRTRKTEVTHEDESKEVHGAPVPHNPFEIPAGPGTPGKDRLGLYLTNNSARKQPARNLHESFCCERRKHEVSCKLRAGPCDGILLTLVPLGVMMPCVPARVGRAG